MKPIGLKFKTDGELMIVHKCLKCQKISNNRIAGDDLPNIILSLVQIQKDSGNLLTKTDIEWVHDVLFGKA